MIPEGQCGEARIEHFDVTKEDAAFTRVRYVASGGRDFPVDPGRYVQLLVEGKLVMSDTRAEANTNRMVVANAKGNVLIAGLGIGLILIPILRKPEVRRVEVIEISADVITLVEAPLRKALGRDAKKLKIIHADVREWEPRPFHRWDTIYFDIWGDFSLDDVEEMEALHSRFRPFLRNDEAWMSSWQYRELKSQADESDEDDWEFEDDGE